MRLAPCTPSKSAYDRKRACFPARINGIVILYECDGASGKPFEQLISNSYEPLRSFQNGFGIFQIGARLIHRAYRMKYLIAALLLTFTQQAYTAEQDHTCQGGHNCNSEGLPTTATAEATAISEGSTAKATGGEGGAGGTANNSIDIENKRSAPGLGLSTPTDSTGIGITTPIGGIMLNLPWSFGDRRLFPVYDRHIQAGNVEAANEVLCLTSVMRKLHNKDHEACTTSLGGGSDPTGK